MKAIALGVHVLDVLVRPVERIPEGQGGDLVEEIKITAAGSAGGTALTLAKLGMETFSAGAIGTDASGDMLLALLEKGGIDTSLVLRREGVPTSATVLPIRPNGDRPALHVIGANGAYGADAAPLEAIAAADFLHFGGPEFMGGEAAGTVLEHARAGGTVTSADVLAPGEPGLLDWIAPALPHVDFFFPNDDQVLAFTGADDLEQGCRLLIDRGADCVVATRGADGVLIVDRNGSESVPAFEVEVVDTTGCGDSFVAGFLRGLSLERSRRDSAILGNAAAALVAQGLGSDAGDFDLDAADEFARTTPARA